ncbi:MAG: M20 family metallopeptidase [Candidatus Eremiobacteraeota bacterium]|nr:M20 family metallopeptidase [Candidatus Eremiobacteraeota bacterium]
MLTVPRLEKLDLYHHEALSFLVRIAGINSGSFNREGISQVMEACASSLGEAGFTTQKLEGNHFLASRRGFLRPRVMILGHMDTAFDVTHPFKEVFYEGERLRGPGVSDMKGGIALVTFALRYLAELGKLDDRTVTVLFNSDEEIHSQSSRHAIEEQARSHDLVMVFEGGKRVDEKTTTYVYQRRGAGLATFTVTGKSSHAGTDHEKGVNALEELGYKVIELQKLTDYDEGTTVSAAGDLEFRDTRKNVVPGWVRFNVDFRFKTPGEAERLIEQFKKIAATPYVRNRYGETAKTDLDVRIMRPPMVPNAQCLRFASILEGLAREIDHPIVEKTRGGGSDGCFTAALGIPTLDGVGPVGDNWHTDKEYLEIASLKKRMELFISFWHSLF